MAVSAVSWFKLDRACEITRDLVANHPLTPDYSSDYMVVQGWPFVVALYSGVEQALKMLLLAQPDACLTLDELRKQPFRHDLKRLFAALPPDDRDHIELHFREHWSLHEYDTQGQVICTAEDFIAHINSGGKQGGAVSWRYALLDETVTLPPTSLWTMCEIWRATCCRVKTKALDKQDDCCRLSRMLSFEFERLVLNTIPVPYDEFIDEINEWIIHKDGDPLAAWMDLFVKTTHNALDGVKATERLRRELVRMAHAALAKMASDTADPDQAMLLHRIRDDPNFVWDRKTATFFSECRS